MCVCVHCCANFKKGGWGHATLCVLVFVRRIRKLAVIILPIISFKWNENEFFQVESHDLITIIHLIMREVPNLNTGTEWQLILLITCVALRLHNILQSEIYRKEEPITVDYKFKFPSIQVLITITISIHLPVIYYDIFKIKDSDSECYKLTGCW